MTITTQPMTVEYIGIENGLSFKITVFQEPGGEFHAQIEVLEGSADFNALYFGDDVLDGSSFSFGKSLGMNGAGQTDQYGNLVDWDSGVKLSDPGLGKLGLNKDTYLTAGETMIVSLPGVDSWDDVAEIGVRATSTSTPSGSIKTVLEPVDVVEEPEEPSVVEAPPAVVDVIEGPTDVTGPATETTTTQPVSTEIDPPAAIDETSGGTTTTETAPLETVGDLPVEETVSDLPVEATVSDIPTDEAVGEVPADETVDGAPTIDTPIDPPSTPDADAAYYEDFANTIGIVEDYPAYEDEGQDVELPPDFVF